MMKNSQAHYPQYEASHYDDYGFDLQEDFSLFLEEAKQAKMKSSLVHPEESSLSEQKNKGMKNNGRKKSWKSSLVSWWKPEKKTKPKSEEHFKDNPKSRKRNGQVSGPIIYNNRNKSFDGNNKQWISNSGPLTNLFKPTKKNESEVPYMYLHQQKNKSHVSQIYGPLYVVT